MAQYKAIVMIPHVKKDGCEFSVEPLVLCKDCKHGYPCKNAAGEDSVECCNHYVSSDSICRKPYWFCADGESKDE